MMKKTLLAQFRNCPRFASAFLTAIFISTMMSHRAHANDESAAAPSSPPDTTSSTGTESQAPRSSTASPSTSESLALTEPGPLSVGTGSHPASTLDPAEGSGLGNVAMAGVEPSTGVAHASIPFQLPQARGAAQPQLGLSYSSVSDVGESGYAWSLTLPKIERHNPGNGPRYKDIAPGAVEGADRFELNGAPLVPVCQISGGQCTGGGTLRAGETVPATVEGWMYFRPETDSAFSRVFWSPDHRTWILQSHGSGLTMQLGAPQDDPSNTDALDLDDRANNAIFRWNLSRLTDANGNAVIYDWVKLSGLGFLSDVFDSERDKANARATAAHHTRLVYNQDSSTVASTPIWRRKRTWKLDHVDVTSANFLATGQRHLVRRYYFNYWARGAFSGQARSMLRTAKLRPACDAAQEAPNGQLPDNLDGPCGIQDSMSKLLYAMSYTGEGGVVPKTGYVNVDHKPDDEIALLDIDGDSIADIIQRQPGANVGTVSLGGYLASPGSTAKMEFAADIDFGAHAEMLFTKPILGDWLRNGRLNALRAIVPEGGEPDVPLYKFFNAVKIDSNRWQWQADAAGRPLSQWTGGTDTYPFNRHNPIEHYADIDLDGYLDRVLLVPLVQHANTPPKSYDDYVINGYTYTTFLTTLDSTNRTVLPFSRITQRTLKEPDEVANSHAGNWIAEVVYEDVVDASGDGIPDLNRAYIWYDADQNEKKSQSYMWLGNGDGSFGETPLPPGTTLNGTDLNGDGIPDAGFVGASGINIELRDEAGGVLVQKHIDAELENDRKVMYADLDGSGINWIIVVPKSSGKIFYVKVPNANIGERPGLLTKISDNAGATTTIYYQTNGSPAMGNPAGMPMPVAIHSVAAIQTTSAADTNSTGGPFITSYTYAEPVYDPYQRRFRGYRSVTEKYSAAFAAATGTYTRFFISTCADGSPADSCANEFAPNSFYEAVRGVPVIRETRAQNGDTETTSHYKYRVRRLYDGMDGRAVRTASSERVDQWRYDNPDGVRPSETVSLPEVVSADEPTYARDRSLRLGAVPSSA